MGFTFFFIAAVVLAMIALFIALALRFRGKRIVTCPETHAPVGAKINAALAAGSWIVAQPRFVVTACSRWPERAGCDQACAPQIEAAPEETLVRNIVAKWYGERTCIYCAMPIGDVSFGAVVPALLAPDGTLREWKALRARRRLPQALSRSHHRPARAQAAAAPLRQRRAFRRRLLNAHDRSRTSLSPLRSPLGAPRRVVPRRGWLGRDDRRPERLRKIDALSHPGHRDSTGSRPRHDRRP
jgi:hypothetical protein